MKETRISGRTTSNVRKLLNEFRAILNVEWEAPPDLINKAEAAIKGCTDSRMRISEVRQQRLLAIVNTKLRLNRERFQCFLDIAAGKRFFLNYHDKATVLECFDSNDRERFERWLKDNGRGKELAGIFKPLSSHETLTALHEQLQTGFVYRKDARQCDASERKDEVLRALFGSYVFHAFPPQAMHKSFNPDCRVEYFPDFYQHLLRFHSKVLRRDCALIFLVIDDLVRENCSSDELRDKLCSLIRDSYSRISNHCFLAILIKPFREGKEDGQWRLFSDLVLYAEKHREVPLQVGYFRHDKIEQQSVQHIHNLDRRAASFNIANEGFFFRDCIVLLQGPSREGVNTASEQASLLLLFDKNDRDETIIPCPACRSFEVAGNSYPTLGVKSWECQNPICPERSAFDRGNRYSLSSLIKQEAIKSEEDQIPELSLRKWKLDVVSDVNEEDVADMLLRHFSLHGDEVLFVNAPDVGPNKHGRRITYEPFQAARCDKGVYSQFQQSSYFKRFIVERDRPSSVLHKRVPTSFDSVEVYQGDCFEVLAQLSANSIDGAVTSPPYYNARSYSVWPNIYCYLYDMYNSAHEVFRVLKPGSVYLFNIFDYFDNENNIVFSAMGKKRMILGAYIVNIFRRVGFELAGNVVWYKGEIEGKRNFNQGNRSSYYQFPLNSWEHVFVFQKPGERSTQYRFPTVLAAKPVFKIINGKNVLGHSAPFPSQIPELLLNQMKPGEQVLDPYSGSMTTGRAAYRLGLRSVSIDIHQDYCQLGLHLLDEENASLLMFNMIR